METYIINITFFRKKRFKSYYVVWKRDFRTLQYAHTEFKSYYVVWKLFSSADKNEKKKGLNRTM